LDMLHDGLVLVKVGPGRSSGVLLLQKSVACCRSDLELCV